MDAGASGDDSESWLIDDEQMMAILSSSLSPAPWALPLSPPWPRTELFGRMPPSPPPPSGMAIVSSSLSPPPLALPLSPPWSPTELFERMPPSPPPPVGMTIVSSSFSPPPSPPWSPTELFERMPPSPPAPVGFLRLWNLDDEYMLPLQIGPFPAKTDLSAATLVATAGISYGGNIEPARKKLKHFENSEDSSPLLQGRNIGRHLSLFENCRNSSLFLKERFCIALRHFAESFVGEHVLIQVWAPFKTEKGYMITTSGQPFWLDHPSIGLLQYRAASMMYVFSLDSTHAIECGLPGRVFKQKVPEWTPNVQYYSTAEYPQLNHAISYNIHGIIALPVFDALTQSCIAVVEVITNSKKINYADEVNKICKALEAVDLTSTNLQDRPNVQIYDEGRQSALSDITSLLSVICETHKLPLAQTWVPCNSQSVMPHGGGVKRSCLCLTGNSVHKVCLATSDVAFHVVDAHMWGFRDACTEHFLHEGQGVSGTAFLSRSSCFSKDVTQLCKLDYPLVHYARMFGLTACLAVCMQSPHTGDDVYILEFFLPPHCREVAEQKALLESVSALMKHSGCSLKEAADENFGSLQDSETFGIDEHLKEADAQNSGGGRQRESPLLLDPRRRSPERVRGTDENYAASMDIVRDHFSGDLTNAGKLRAKSEVWQHFMKNGARAYCKHCSKDYAADSRKHGTSRLRRHLVDAHNLKVGVEADTHSLQTNDMTVTEKQNLKETNSKSSQSTHCELLGHSTPNSTCNTVVSTDVQYKLSGETMNLDKSRAKSEVWQHFTKDGSLAHCRYCTKVYEADSRKNGTSRLWRHLSGFHRINKRLLS